MPKDRKRKNMLIIACIMLFAILFTLVPAFSFSVTAARGNTEIGGGRVRQVSVHALTA